MSKKSRTYKISEKRKEEKSLILKGGYVRVKIDGISDHLQNVNRGAGIIKSKKIYDRKKNNRMDDNYDCSFYFMEFHN